VLLGAGAGFAGAFLNPFTIGIAHGVAGLPLFSGIQLRLVAYALMVGSTIIYIYRYASKIHKNPELSVMYEEDKKNKAMLNYESIPEFNNKHRIVLTILVLGLIILILGVVKFSFYINELSAVFIIMGIAAGIAAGFNGGKNQFTHFSHEILPIAKAAMKYPEVGVITFVIPSPNWKARTDVCLVKPTTSAKGAIIGMVAAA